MLIVENQNVKNISTGNEKRKEDLKYKYARKEHLEQLSSKL